MSDPQKNGPTAVAEVEVRRQWVEPWVLDGAIAQRDEARRLVNRFMRATPRQMEAVRRAAERAMKKW